VFIQHTEHDPVTATGDVAKQMRRAVAIGDENVHAAVVVDVAEGRTPAGGDEHGRGSAARMHFGETAVG
jgi:hypothetical protein